MKRGAALFVALSTLVITDVPAIASDAGLFSPDGYRISRYRAALAEQPPAGQRIGTQALLELIERDAPVLVDVQAVTVRGESVEFGQTWLPSSPRYHLPNSVWLPNVGYGELSVEMADYLNRHLDRLTGGDENRPIVFYCIVDCWMSWNAVKRADALGYRRLYWYAEGTDGWEDAGLPLELAQPLPMAPQ